MQMLDDLIARLESAEEGSRELDVRVQAVVTPDAPVLTNPGNYKGEGVEWTPLSKVLKEWEAGDNPDWEGLAVGRAPHYTTSLDAALTLVPEAWFTQLRGPWKGGMHMADIAPNPFIDTCHEREDGQDGYAASGPLALTIAALKARKALEST